LAVPAERPLVGFKNKIFAKQPGFMIEEEIGLDQYFAAVWRVKWIVLTGVIVVAAVIAAVEYNRPILYSANAVLKVGQVWKEPLQDPFVTTEIANNDGFLQAVGTRVGKDTNTMKRQLHAETITGGPARLPYALLVRLTAVAENADESVRIAQAAAAELLARHEKLFDEALAPRLLHQQRLDEMIRQLPGSTTGKAAADTERADLGTYPRKVQKVLTAMAGGQLLPNAKIMREFADDEMSNTSPTQTHKTELVDPVVPGASIKPPIGREALVTGLIAALIYAAAALAFEYFSMTTFRKRSHIVSQVATHSQPDATGS
jgi:hypothetical protein